MSRQGFSLIELLVVLAVIVVLIGLLLPVLGAVRESARSVTCLADIQQIGLATRLYADDYDQLLPRSSHSALAYRVMPWGYALSPYLGGETFTGPGPAWDRLFEQVYRCPSDHRLDAWSYGKSVWFELTGPEIGELNGESDAPTYPSIDRVPRPSATVLYGELGSGSMTDHIMAHFWYLGGEPEVDADRHGALSNYVYVDGHADARVFSDTFDRSTDLDRWRPDKAR